MSHEQLNQHAPAYIQEFILLIGEPQGGKSFYANKQIELYNALGWACVVYNLGRRTDFPAAKYVEGLGTKKHLQYIKDPAAKKAYKEAPFIRLYEDIKGNLFSWKKVCLPVSKGGIIGQPIKLHRLVPLYESENLFFEVIYDYFANTLVVFDDMRGVFKHGLKGEMSQLFSRINHGGNKCAALNWQGKGCTCIVILHSLEAVPFEMWDYISKVVCFKYTVKPNPAEYTPELARELQKSHEWLQGAEKYAHTITDVKNKTTVAQLPSSNKYFSI